MASIYDQLHGAACGGLIGNSAQQSGIQQAAPGQRFIGQTDAVRYMAGLDFGQQRQYKDKSFIEELREEVEEWTRDALT